MKTLVVGEKQSDKVQDSKVQDSKVQDSKVQRAEKQAAITDRRVTGTRVTRLHAMVGAIAVLAGDDCARMPQMYEEDSTPYVPHNRNFYTGRDVPRNKPCPCGSGKKYKKCCMRTDRPMRDGETPAPPTPPEPEPRHAITIMPSTGQIVHCCSHVSGELTEHEVLVDLAKLPECSNCGTPVYHGQPVWAGCSECRYAVSPEVIRSKSSTELIVWNENEPVTWPAMWYERTDDPSLKCD